MQVYLVHADDEMARELSADCEEAAIDVVRITDAGADAVRELGDERPDALLVGLDGDWQHALDMVAELGQRRRLRGVPLVFCGGVQDALTRAQDAHPRASFARRDVVLNVLASLRS